MQHQTEPISSESARGCPSHRLSRAWVHCPRAPEQFVASPLCLVGYVRWDARSDRVPPLQTIIFSSFTGRTKGCPTIRESSRGGSNPKAEYSHFYGQPVNHPSELGSFDVSLTNQDAAEGRTCSSGVDSGYFWRIIRLTREKAASRE